MINTNEFFRNVYNLSLINPIQGGGKNTCASLFHQITVGGQQKMTTLMVCKLNLVYQQKTEAKKV